MRSPVPPTGLRCISHERAPAATASLLTVPRPGDDPLPMSALLPPLLLLLWSGLAATLVTTLVLAPLFGVSAAALSPAPARPRVLSALLAGTLALPLVYALGFALLREASLLTGTLLGGVLALGLVGRSVAAGGRELLRENGRRGLIWVAYGTLLGFVHTIP